MADISRAPAEQAPHKPEENLNIRAEGHPGVFRVEKTPQEEPVKGVPALTSEFTDALAQSNQGRNPDAFKQFNNDLRRSLTDAYANGGFSALEDRFNKVNEAIPGTGIGLNGTRDKGDLAITPIVPLPSNMSPQDTLALQSQGRIVDNRDGTYSLKVGETLKVSTDKMDDSPFRLQEVEKYNGPLSDRAKNLAEDLKKDVAMLKEHGHSGITEDWAKKAAELADQYGGIKGGLDLAKKALNDALKGTGFEASFTYQDGCPGIHGNTVVEFSVGLKQNGQEFAMYQNGHDTVRGIGGPPIPHSEMNVYDRSKL